MRRDGYVYVSVSASPFEQGLLGGNFRNYISQEYLEVKNLSLSNITFFHRIEK